MARFSLFQTILLITLNLNLFFQIKTDKIEQDPTLKALSCIKLINKDFKIEDPKSSNDFQLILTCYTTITYDQSTKILEIGPESLNSEEIINLTDLSMLQKYSEDEVKKNTVELENAIKMLQLKNEAFSKEDKNKENNEEGNDNKKDDNNNDIYNDIHGEGDGDGDLNNFGNEDDNEFNDPYDDSMDNMEYNDPYDDNMEYNDMYDDSYDGMYDGAYDDGMYDGDGDYYNENRRKYVYDPEFEKKKKVVVIILVTIFGILTIYFLFVVINDQKTKSD
jgi:hypothetical protein